MKIVFISNYLNHHQRPFIESLARNGCNITFVAMSKMSQERAMMGYSSEMERGRVIQFSQETASEIYELTMDADAVVFGSKPQKLFQMRVRSGKLTFNFSERLFKKGALMAFSPVHQIKLRKKYRFDRENTPYLLAAGEYSAQDYRSLGYPKEKILKWGYFPPLSSTPKPELLQNKQENTIIWVARFIPLKHPEHIVELGKYLKKRDISFHIKMIGIGELLAPTMEMIEANGLSEYIEIVGALPPEQVRQEFEKAQIALLTSDRNEGWGAVVNEAMNSACAFVGNRSIGATTYLINDGENGMTYRTKRQMFRKVEQLLKNPQLSRQLGENAYHTITDTWNHEEAAKRFVEFAESQTVCRLRGPMSGA